MLILLHNIDEDEYDDTDDDDALFLRLCKVAKNIPRQVYQDIRGAIAPKMRLPSLRRMKERLQRLTHIKRETFDCCPNSCMAFTGEYKAATNCSYCNEDRYVDENGKARKSWSYIPLVSRLKLQYLNPGRAKVLTNYRHGFNLGSTGGVDRLRDVFDGRLYREFHVQELSLFTDPHDIALHLSLDGMQVTNMKNHEITPVILINLNLPPDQRYKIENILASMLIPGPKKPKNIDTFLRPLVDELLLLDKGVSALDGNSRINFQLRAWVTIVTGDGPGLAEAIGMKRPGNAYRPCRTCNITANRGGGRIYYVPHDNYDFANQQPRVRLRELIEKVADAEDREKYGKLTGISRKSVLLELRSIHFPRSFPADLMHLVLLNVTPTLYKLWNRTKLSIDKANHTDFEVRPYHLDDSNLTTISTALVEAKKGIPTYLGHAPRAIESHHKGYKAAEWAAWLKLYGVPLLDQRLDESYVENFRLLSRIYTLATQHSLRQADVGILDNLVQRFVKTFESLYYQGDPKKLPVCTINVHSLVHLPTYVQDCGPAWGWWQFAMERYCGIVKPKAYSKSQLDSGLANAVIITEMINHIPFLQLPCVQETIQQTSYPLLQGGYRTTLRPYQRDHLEATYGKLPDFRFFKRCQLTESLNIGSAVSQGNDDITRYNHRICYLRPGYNSKEFGEVLFFLRAVTTNGEVKNLAWVRNFDGIDIDNAKRIASFGNRSRRRSWVDVAWMVSLIGIIRDDNINLIISDVDLFDG